MKNKQQIQEEIDILVKQQKEQDAKIKELQEQLNKSEKWQDSLVQPNKEWYYYIADGEKEGLRIYRDINNIHRKPEYAFRKHEQAELIKEKMLLMQEMFAFAHVKNEGKLPDWNNRNSKKWGIYYNKIWEINYYNDYNLFTFGVSFNKKEDAKEAFEIFGDRIQRYYNQSY